MKPDGLRVALSGVALAAAVTIGLFPSEGQCLSCDLASMDLELEQVEVDGSVVLQPDEPVRARLYADGLMYCSGRFLEDL